MKKFSLLIAILLIVSFGLSAAVADSAQFTINTAVTGISDVRVGNQGKDFQSKSDFVGINEVPSITIGPLNEETGAGMEHPLAVYAMTNVNGTYSVTTTAKPLRIGVDGFILKYTVTVGGTDYEVDSAAGTAITFISNFSQSNGLSFAKQDFTVSVTEDDFEAAEAGTYSATWTIELATN